MKIESYKEYLHETLSSRIQSGTLGDTRLGNLRSIQRDMNSADTLSELLRQTYDSGYLLFEEIGSEWIKRLQETATEGQLHDHRLMIDPKEIRLSNKEPRHLALFTDPKKVVQQSGEIAYVGVSEVHVLGGKALVKDDARVSAEGISQVIGYDRAYIIGTESSKVILSGYCRCEAYGNCDVDAHSNSWVIAKGNNKVWLTDAARGIAYTGSQSWELQHKSQLLIPVSYNSKDSLLVNMKEQSHVFNCAEHVKLDINNHVGSKGSVVTCASKPIQEALLQIFLSPQKKATPTEWIDFPISLEESRRRILPSLPSNLSSEEKERFHNAPDAMELCCAVESIMRHHPGHGISADTLASAFTNDVLQLNHIRLYGNYLGKPEPNTHYHLYGNGVLCPNYGDTNTYHMHGRSMAICHGNTPIIASDNALLIQVEGGKRCELYGHAEGLLIDGGSVAAHAHSKVTSAGEAAVKLDGHATAISGGQSTVGAYGESRVVAMDEAKVDLYDKSHGAALLNSQASVTIRSKDAVGGLLEKEDSIEQFLHGETTSLEKKVSPDTQEQRGGWKR